MVTGCYENIVLPVHLYIEVVCIALVHPAQ